MDDSAAEVSSVRVSRQNKRIRAVLFDLDDTLLDWSNMSVEWRDLTHRHLDKVHDYLSAEGHNLPEKDLFFRGYIDILIRSWDEAKETWAGVHFTDVLGRIFAAYGLDQNQIDFQKVMASYDWQPVPGVVPYDDTIPVLDCLRRRGYRIGLITNSMFPMWMRDIELRAYDLIDYFDVRITSGEAGYMKPHPEIYTRALEILDALPEQSLFVGDRPANDIAGANESGLISVLMSPPHLDFELNGVRPDYTITSLTELLIILDRLEQDSHDETGT